MLRRPFLAFFLATGACGGATEPTASATTPSPAPRDVGEPGPAERDPRADPSPPPWPEMSYEERLSHMQRVVLPKMKALFRAHDSAAFATFNCASCHGADGKARRYAMPSEALPRLDPANGFAAHERTHPEMTAWMKSVVVPAMAEALEVAIYDPATHQGFGCFNCHQQQP
jgi:hypothetical protein